MKTISDNYSPIQYYVEHTIEDKGEIKKDLLTVTIDSSKQSVELAINNETSNDSADFTIKGEHLQLVFAWLKLKGIIK